MDGTQQNKHGTWLFDLSNDLGEIDNLAKKYPDIVIRYLFFHITALYFVSKNTVALPVNCTKSIYIHIYIYTCVVCYIHQKHCITRTGNKTGNHTEKLN